MKNFPALIGILFLIACSSDDVSATEKKSPSLSPVVAEAMYQEDADLVRLHDLAYWTGIIGI